jgi:hypothetical protein
MKSNIEDDGFETVHPPIARAEILKQASDAVTRDRAATHGDAENSFSQIAATWSWWLGERLEGQIDAYDVSMMMALFKMARAKGNRHHFDNFVDAAAYSALAGEMANRPATKVTKPDDSDVWFA